MAMPDNDNDGIEDWREQRAVCSDPTKTDTNYDQLIDGDEVYKYQTNPCHHDPDNDNFPDNDEVARGTNAFVADTDGDGVNDGDEVFRDLTDPLVPNNVPAPKPAPAPAPGERPDRDQDWLFDDDETNVYGTNPDVSDTDGDGSDDGQEVFDGTDPLDPNDP